MKGSSYTIYNASAGAGKTYTLVKNFLKILLENESPETIRSILAVTFTNKASNEMKSRILTWLHNFSDENNYSDNLVLQQISAELKLDKKEIHKRAKKRLSYILHHYSLLSVSTIDKFNLRLMKSFTKELGLSYSFSIELDASEYLKQSIDELIDELGTDSPFAEVILNYIFWKFETEASTDIRKELLFSSQNFLKEIHLDKIIKITNKEIEDFEKLNTLLTKRIQTNKGNIKKQAESIIILMNNNGLQQTDFYQGAKGMGGFFQKILNEDRITFTSSYYKAFCEEEKYTASKTQKEIEIKQIAPEIIKAFYSIKDLLNRVKIDESVKKNLITIELQSEITRFLAAKKEDNDVLFLSDVNPIISKHLKEEPVAFIYEKLGGRYNHYFIDEFQDTSQLQWDNFFPLIENARVSNGTSITLVGDPKQSIYRFRSGKPEILIDLISEAEKQNINVVTLTDNYRSLPNIVQFNNSFYQYLSDYELVNPEYKILFGEKAKQKPIIENGGRVQVSFVPKEDEEQNYLAERILQIVQECLVNGFNYRDITILTRNKKNSIPIVDILINNHFPILTEEALLVNSSASVQIIIRALRWLNNTEDKEQLVLMLYQLWEQGKIEFKDFTKEILVIKDLSFQKTILFLKEQYQLSLKYEQTSNLSFYDFAEELILSLGFGSKEEMYISTLLDFILLQEKNGIITIQDFLENWDLQSSKLSVRFPENMNSIQIMTIHKSKGLEFPVVIYPLTAQKSHKEEYWFPLDEKMYNGFDKFYTTGKTGLDEADSGIEEVVKKKDLEKLIDELCIQYVATTRASQQLFLLEEITEKKDVSYLQKYLANNNIPPEGIIELFPDSTKKKVKEKDRKNILEDKITWLSARWNEKIRVSTEVRKFYTEENKHIQYGNVLHSLLAELNGKEELPKIIKKAIVSGLITVDEAQQVQNTLWNIINKPELEIYFSEHVNVYTEREILFEGRFYRPDRVVEINNTFTIIDFKTGEKHPKHKKQVELYAHALQKFGKNIQEKLLVYLYKDNSIEVEKI